MKAGGQMLSVDVNVLVHAFDESSPRHGPARSFLEGQIAGPGLLILFPTVVSGFLRVMTDRRILESPAEPEQALAFIRVILEAPNVRLVGAEARAWSLFDFVVGRYALRGPDITDGLLVACCVAVGATWASFDRGFARFGELTWQNPADES